MKYIVQSIVSFANTLDDLKRLHCECSQQLSRVDKELSQLYHRCETENFNACQGYYLAKQIKEVCQRRRKIKEQMSVLDFLNHLINKEKNAVRLIKQKAKEMKVK